MKNYKVILQYEGTRYQGWQKQDSTDNTIQGKLEALLGKMTGRTVAVDGSGRTDAGVHAYGQVANFHIDTDKTPEEIMDYMNEYLPEDIAVIAIEIVGERFHSRLNAKQKTYQYRVRNSKIPDVFNRKYVYEVTDALKIGKMREAADRLTGTHDFKAFTSTKKGKKSTVRTIESIRIEEMDGEIRFTYTGDGFLYHMVRILTGTLLEVGMGKKQVEEMDTILASCDRQQAGMLIPSKGLCLIEVRYE